MSETFLHYCPELFKAVSYNLSIKILEQLQYVKVTELKYLPCLYCWAEDEKSSWDTTMECIVYKSFTLLISSLHPLGFSHQFCCTNFNFKRPFHTAQLSLLQSTHKVHGTTHRVLLTLLLLNHKILRYEATRRV